MRSAHASAGPQSGARGRFVLTRAARCVLLAALAVAASVAVAQAARIGYVDMKRLLDNAPQIQAGKDALQREFAERDVALKAQQVRLTEQETRQKRDAAILPRDVADALAFEIDTLRRGIATTRERMRDDLNARMSQELSRRWPEIHDAVIEYARENDYDLVVEEPVLYASAAVDITDEVLDRLKRAWVAQQGPSQ